VPALLQHQTERFPERELLVSDDDRITYGELDRRSAALAAHLLGQGVGTGARVGILLPNGPEFLVTFFAIVRIGGVAVPVSTLSTGPELARIIRHAGFALLIATDHHLTSDFLERLDTALGTHGSALALASLAAPHLRQVWLWRGHRPWAKAVPLAPSPLAQMVSQIEARVAPADTLAIIYTSGSTSDPKGVVHSHGAFVRSSRRWAASMPYRNGDRLFATGPMFWVGGLVTSLLTMVQVGGTLVNSPRSGSALLDVIEKERCTAIQVWPYLSRRIAEDPTFASRDWSAMRAGTVPGMVPDPGAKPNAAPFGFAMGMTETAGPHTLAMGEIDEEHRGAMGLLAPGMEHRIVDPETRAVLGEGERGILEVRGDTLMMGYVGRERHETFDADGWFDTGDLCTIRDGHVFFHGRSDAMIKTSGANVSPAEVEAALLEIDGVAEAHALGLPDATRGQIVGALVVPQEGRTLDRETVLGEARKRLSSYKVPRRVVIADKAPLTGTNKLDRRAAARLLQDPAPEAIRS
jgi:acyl-CoA synthetase (AMP-forming)/AMP-acid ligase II